MIYQEKKGNCSFKLFCRLKEMEGVARRKKE